MNGWRGGVGVATGCGVNGEPVNCGSDEASGPSGIGFWARATGAATTSASAAVVRSGRRVTPANDARSAARYAQDDLGDGRLAGAPRGGGARPGAEGGGGPPAPPPPGRGRGRGGPAGPAPAGAPPRGP